MGKLSKALQSAAYHEAGHAVLAWHGRITITSIWIHTEHSGGQIKHTNPLYGIDLDWDGSTRARVRLEKAIKFSLAGELAQKKFNPRSFRRYHSAGDRESAIKYTLLLGGTQQIAEAYLNLLRLQAEAILDRYWHCVEALAEELLNQPTKYKKKTLSGKRSRRVIIEAHNKLIGNKTKQKKGQ
jgi:hypothetical protein